MTWKKLVDEAAELATEALRRRRRDRVTQLEAQAVAAELLELIRLEVFNGRPVRIPGFGTFYRASRAPRRLRNPRTRELMIIGRSESIGFRAAKAAKRGVEPCE